MAPKSKEDIIRAKVEQERIRQKVLELHQAGGLTLKQIADHPEVRKPKSTVQSIISAFSGQESMQDKPGAGRPKKFTSWCDFGVFKGVFFCFTDTKGS